MVLINLILYSIFSCIFPPLLAETESQSWPASTNNPFCSNKKESAFLFQNSGLAWQSLNFSHWAHILDIKWAISHSSLSSLCGPFAWAGVSSAPSWWKRSCTPTPSVDTHHKHSAVFLTFYLMWGVKTNSKSYHNDDCVQQKRNGVDQRYEHALRVKVLEIGKGPAKK